MGKNNINNKDDDDRRKKIFALLPFIGGVALLATVIGVSMPNVVTKLPKRSELNNEPNVENHKKTLEEAILEMNGHDGFLTKLRNDSQGNLVKPGSITKTQLVDILKTDPQSAISTLADEEKARLQSTDIALIPNNAVGILKFNISKNNKIYTFSISGMLGENTEHDRVAGLLQAGVANNKLTIPQSIEDDYIVNVFSLPKNSAFTGDVISGTYFREGLIKLTSTKDVHTGNNVVDLEGLDDAWIKLLPKNKANPNPNRLNDLLVTVDNSQQAINSLVGKAAKTFAGIAYVNVIKDGISTRLSHEQLINDLLKLYSKNNSSTSMRLSILSAILGVRHANTSSDSSYIKPYKIHTKKNGSTGEEIDPFDIEYWTPANSAFRSMARSTDSHGAIIPAPTSPEKARDSHRFVFQNILSPIGKKDVALDLLSASKYSGVDPNNLTNSSLKSIRDIVFNKNDTTHLYKANPSAYKYSLPVNENIVSIISQSEYINNLKKVWESVYALKTFSDDDEISVKRYPFLKYIPNTSGGTSEIRDHIAHYLDQFFKENDIFNNRGSNTYNGNGIKYFPSVNFDGYAGSDIPGSTNWDNVAPTTGSTNPFSNQWSTLLTNIAAALGLLSSDDYGDFTTTDSGGNIVDHDSKIMDGFTLFSADFTNMPSWIKGDLKIKLQSLALSSDRETTGAGGFISAATTPLIQHSMASRFVTPGFQRILFPFVMKLIFSKNPEEVMASLAYSVGTSLFLDTTTTLRKIPITSLWQWDQSVLSRKNPAWTNNVISTYKEYILGLFRNYDHSSSGSTPRKRSNHLPIERTLMTHEIYKSREEEGDDE